MDSNEAILHPILQSRCVVSGWWSLVVAAANFNETRRHPLLLARTGTTSPLIPFPPARSAIDGTNENRITRRPISESHMNQRDMHCQGHHLFRGSPRRSDSNTCNGAPTRAWHVHDGAGMRRVTAVCGGARRAERAHGGCGDGIEKAPLKTFLEDGRKSWGHYVGPGGGVAYSRSPPKPRAKSGARGRMWSSVAG